MHAKRMSNALLVVGLALVAPVAAQEEPEPGAWRAAAEDSFTLHWTYHLSRQEKTFEGPNDLEERREVTARLRPEAPFSGTGRLRVEVLEVHWTYEAEAFQITLDYEPAKSPDPTLKVKPSDDPEAEAEADAMLERVQATYRIVCRSGMSSLQVEVGRSWSGGATAPSLFDRCYLHSDLPDEMASSLRWDDERDPESLPLYAYPGRVEEHPIVTLRAIKVSGEAGVKASGSGAVKFKGRDYMDRTYKGKSSIKRSFEISGAGHLAKGHEEAKSSISKKDLGKLVIVGKIAITQDVTVEK